MPASVRNDCRDTPSRDRRRLQCSESRLPSRRRIQRVFVRSLRCRSSSWRPFRQTSEPIVRPPPVDLDRWRCARHSGSSAHRGRVVAARPSGRSSGQRPSPAGRWRDRVAGEDPAIWRRAAGQLKSRDVTNVFDARSGATSRRARNFSPTCARTKTWSNAIAEGGMSLTAHRRAWYWRAPVRR